MTRQEACDLLVWLRAFGEHDCLEKSAARRPTPGSDLDKRATQARRIVEGYPWAEFQRAVAAGERREDDDLAEAVAQGASP